MFRRIIRGGACLALLACLIGCGQGGDADRPATAPVTGTVTYNGTAVEGATVMFTPTSGEGYSSVGVTDAKGKFTLMSQWGGAGAVPGSYQVSISKTEAEVKDAEGEEARVEEDGGPAAVTEHLPVKYKSPDTAELPAEVKADEKNDFPFDLSD